MSEPSCAVGFLRAVNVGGRTVTKEQLCAILEGHDLGTVSTFLASGNVLFEGVSLPATEIETRVETALAAALGYPVETFVRSIGEVVALVAEPCFRPAPGVAVHVGFVRSVPTPDAWANVARLVGPADQVQIHGRELWWRRDGRVSDSPLATAALGRALGQPATLRTLRTLERIAARYPR
jgi:uncharacterized protein (DUF1697 family)